MQTPDGLITTHFPYFQNYASFGHGADQYGFLHNAWTWVPTGKLSTTFGNWWVASTNYIHNLPHLHFIIFH